LENPGFRRLIAFARVADRVIILGANPGHIRGEISIDLPRPRATGTTRYIDELLTILDAAALLGFVEVSEGIVTVTEDGRRFATADILRSKELFRQQALTHAPLVTAICQTLREKRDGSMWSDYILDILDGYFPAE
jgi:NitT/TauT family transport system ATP-binding protein